MTSSERSASRRTRHASRVLHLLVAGAFTLFGVAVLADDPPDIAKLTEQLGASDTNSRREAALRLGQSGPAAKQAVPALVKALGDSDKQVWSYAFGALAALGPDAKEAIPALLDAMDGRKGRSDQRGRNQVLVRSAYALTRIGAAAIPPLIQALGADDTPLRTGATKALGGMGPAAREAIPALVANLGHDDAVLRRDVIDALAAIGPEAKPKLIEALGWNAPLQRSTAALALGEFGKAAQDAAPALLERLAGETDPGVRASLLTALAKVGADPARLIPVLIDALRSDDEPLRHAAANALLTLRAAQTTPALMSFLRDPNPVFSQRAAYVLGRMGTKDAAPAIVEAALKQPPPAAVFADALVQIGEPAVPEILRAVEKEKPEAITGEHWGVKCLASIGGPAVPRLTKALASPSLPVRLVAARALSGLGEDAAGAEPALLDALSDADARLRTSALGALAAAKTSSKVLVPRLETALKDQSPAVRRAALQIVPTLDDTRATLAPAVGAALKDGDVEVRMAALPAFASVEGDPAKKTQAFAGALEDGDAGVRRAGVASLAALGEKAADTAPKFLPLLRSDSERGFALEALRKLKVRAVPPLIEMLQVNDAAVRVLACERLASLGADARDAIPPLQGLLQDAQENVRTEARKALDKIEPPK